MGDGDGDGGDGDGDEGDCFKRFASFLFGFRTGQPLGEFKSRAQRIRGFSGNFGGEM